MAKSTRDDVGGDRERNFILCLRTGLSGKNDTHHRAFCTSDEPGDEKTRLGSGRRACDRVSTGFCRRDFAGSCIDRQAHSYRRDKARRGLLSIAEMHDNAQPSSPPLLPRGEGRFEAQMDCHPFMQNSIEHRQSREAAPMRGISRGPGSAILQKRAFHAVSLFGRA